jgi:hypothetical protein
MILVWHRNTSRTIDWFRWIVVTSRSSYTQLLLAKIRRIRWYMRNMGITRWVLNIIGQVIYFPMRRINILALRMVRSRSRRRINIRPMRRIRLWSQRTLGGILNAARIRLPARCSGRDRIGYSS